MSLKNGQKSLEPPIQIQCKDELSTLEWLGHNVWPDLSPAMSAMFELAMADFFSRASFSNFFFVNLKGAVSKTLGSTWFFKDIYLGSIYPQPYKSRPPMLPVIPAS